MDRIVVASLITKYYINVCGIMSHVIESQLSFQGNTVFTEQGNTVFTETSQII
jgi:hypothetical protein